MKKFFLALTACCLLVSCKDTDHKPLPPDTDAYTVPRVSKPEPNTLVVAGKSIGNIPLELDTRKLEGLLGSPDLQDAAMGKAWQTWYSTNSDEASGKYELNVYTEYKDDKLDQKVVRLVRVTSPEFRIAGVGPQSSLAEIREQFPQLASVGDYAFKKTKDFVELYDDEKSGITFEILSSDNRCVGLLIHPVNESVVMTYRTFRPDMTIR